MKKNFLFISIFLFCFIISSFSQVTSTDFPKLSWLEGVWTSSKTKPGMTGNERWIKISSTEWLGYGVNMKGIDTTFMEKLKIILKDEKIYYVADVPENKEPVLFLLTAITDHSFICENPRHDFPTKIAYEKEGDKLKAVISGRGKSIEYLFEKK